MAGVKISALPVIPVAPALTDIFPEVQPASGGTTYKTTFQQLYNLFSLSAGTVNAGTINQLTYYAATGNAVSGLAGINSGALVTGATGVPTWLGSLTNGQIVIGSTGAIPVATTLTAGSNITITNGAGSISIASSGNMSWSAITSATQTIVINNGYIANRGGGVAFALPATSVVGSVFSIVGLLGTWLITQAAGQQISVGATATTVGATGTLTAAAASDSATFVCTVANLSWQVVGGPQTVGFVLA